MSLTEIGAVMSRPLVGIEEEPSELERVCLRVREVSRHGPRASTSMACHRNPLIALLLDGSLHNQSMWMPDSVH